MKANNARFLGAKTQATLPLMSMGLSRSNTGRLLQKNVKTLCSRKCQKLSETLQSYAPYGKFWRGYTSKVIKIRKSASQERSGSSKSPGRLAPGGKSGISRLRTTSCRTLGQAWMLEITPAGNLVSFSLVNGRNNSATTITKISRCQKAGVTNSWRETRSSWKNGQPLWTASDLAR